MKSIAVLIFATLLDFIIGDPKNWIHPVQGIGWVISVQTKLIFKLSQNPLIQRIAGIFLCFFVTFGSAFTAWLSIKVIGRLHPVLGIGLEIILLASCFALKSLQDAAKEVIQPLKNQDIILARSVLSNYVGRDTANLSESEVLRAVLETVGENATDGVMAPLFFAIIGSFISFLGAVPCAIAYKAISTLDSMVGYREAPYTYVGWFSARLEDILTWIPCRLTVLTLAIISGKPLQVWEICRRDAPKDPSPNSGWSECAYAAILGVQMGGTNWYRGVPKYKPLLGDATNVINLKSIYKALNLTRYCFLLWLGGGTSLLLIALKR
ncbi:MAG: adenosylcobinamide-phosphate synthase CbiB [Cyanobacteria bacterium P01_A01_bin.45]